MGRTLLKIIVCIMVAILVVIFVFWLCMHYEINYKKTVCDTSVSPDGKYELTLQAVGEPDWPFGPANGRLILKAGEDHISQTDFTLRDDGKKIRSSCWKVTWYDKYVEVILSGEEQSDEQVLLYFNCEVEVNEKPCAHELRRSYIRDSSHRGESVNPLLRRCPFAAGKAPRS